MEKVSIKEFFNVKEIFMTGGSGFVGRALIEKLLRSCSNLKVIYILMRPKKSVSAHDRVKGLLENPLFDIVKNQNPGIFQKLQIIEGDCSQIGLGIKSNDLEKLKSVSVIFHSAASIRFNDPLKQSILLNTRGTRELCELAEKLPNLEAFVHVSTAYCNPNRKVVEEVIYPSTADWRYYINFAEKFDEVTLDQLETKLVNFYPNTYTFTKYLAEQICKYYKEERNLPVTVYRPSIIFVSEAEPEPGWVNSENAPIGFMFAYCSGIAKSVHCNPKNGFDTIPIDICVKGAIIAAWNEYVRNQNQLIPSRQPITVYNAASIESKFLKYDCMLETVAKTMQTIPFKQMFWTPWTVLTSCSTYAYLIMCIFQIFPAFVCDSILKLLNREPRVLKFARKFRLGNRMGQFVLFHEFVFKNKNFINLRNDVLDCDKKDFFMDERIHSPSEYVKTAYLASIKHMYKQTEEETEIALKQVKIMRIIDIVFKNLLFFAFSYILLKQFF